MGVCAFIRGRRSGPPLVDTKMTRFTCVGDTGLVSFFPSTYENLFTAIKLRVFYRKTNSNWELISDTPHDSGVYSSPLFTSSFAKHAVETAQYSDDEFIATYLGRRRHVYLKAREQIYNDGLLYRDRDCKCFLKKEKDIRTEKPDAIPRVITFPDPKYGLSIGVYIKAIEKPFFKAIDSMFGSPTVMKGLNYVELGEIIENKWNRFSDPSSVDGDVSRLDSSISVEALNCYIEHSSMFVEYDQRETYVELMRRQINPMVKGRTKNGKLSYIGSGLGSGQQNTSQTGVFVVCFILWQLINKYHMLVEVINCGDDFSIIGDRKEVHLFIHVAEKEFLRYNMILKLEKPNYYIEGLNFCQTNPVKIDGKYRMVRNPLRAIIKDSASIDNLDTPTLQTKWLHAVSCSGIATHGGVPVLQEVYACFARNSVEMRSKLKTRSARKKSLRYDVRDNSMKYWGKGLCLRYVDNISNATRWSFYLAFGIDPNSQRFLERYYRDLVITNVKSIDIMGDGQIWKI